MKPVWILQTNFASEVDRWISAFHENSSDYVTIQIVPFSEQLPDIHPPIHPTCITICHGTTTLIKNAPKKGWGVFFDPEKFRPSTWNKIYGEHMLNHDGYVERIRYINIIDDAFVRPDGDFKDFSGSRVDREGFEKFRQSVAEGGYHFDIDTEIFVAPLKELALEWRCFIVNGKVVAGSRYKLGHMLAKKSGLPPNVEQYANDMAKIWSPEEAFVMDICQDRNEKLHILELNCFNASGVYESDVSAIVKAVEDLFKTS